LGKKMDEERRTFLRAVLAITSGAFAALLPAMSNAAQIQTSRQKVLTGPYRFTRSRRLSLPKVTVTPLQLLKTQRAFPFAKASIRGKRRPRKTLSYTPGAWFDNPSLEGGEEGALINNATGLWLAGGDPHNMLAWAEAHGSLPDHWVDPDTGRIYSIVDHPTGTAHKNPAFTTDSPILLDGAHYPSLCFVPYLATGDRYYLEEVQFAANYHLWSMNPEYRGRDQGFLYTGETRAYAWGLRDLVAAYLATPAGDVPAPLLPKAHWGRIIDNNRAEFERRWVKNGVNNPLTGCHFAVDLKPNHVAPWQQDWLGAVMGWMIWTGDPLLAKWRANYEWHMRQAIDRSSGQAGYPRSRAVQYYYKTGGVSGMASLASVNGLKEAGNGRIPRKTNMHYAESLRANLKLAALNGIPGAAECFAWLDPQVTTIDPKWAV
jgi:hypothetical protein